MKKTGSLLKSKRESANLSISEVALATKINPKVLSAIENGDEKSLPAKTILKGFVKSYALFLKMDVEEVMNAFQEECGGPKPQMHHPVEQTRNESSPSSRRRVNDESSSGLRTIAVVVIVILIGMIIGVRELIEKYQREKVVESPVALTATPVEVPKTEVAPVAENHAADHHADIAKTEETASEVKPEEKHEEAKHEEAEAKHVEVEKPAEPAKTPEHEVAETKYPEFKPEMKPIVIATSIFPNMVELRPTKPVETKPEEAKSTASAEPAKPVEVAKAPEPAKTPEPAKPAEPAQPSNKPDATSAAVTPSSPLKAMKNEIILEALDKVEVKFQVGGETKRVSLGPQEVHTIRADEPLTLDLSDGGAVNIIFNGRDRGPAGDLGKPKTLKIP
jgi:cytoskeletal protein RodZ